MAVFSQQFSFSLKEKKTIKFTMMRCLWGSATNLCFLTCGGKRFTGQDCSTTAHLTFTFFLAFVFCVSNSAILHEYYD